MNKEKLPDTNPNAGLLSKWGILALGVGGCIGSGVISLLGYGIGRTGHSVWLAFAIALLMGFIICIPVLFVTGSVCLPGGTYSLITAILGKKAAGVYIITFFLNLPGIALYGLAMGQYIQSFLPGVSVRLAAIVIFTLFFLYTLIGIKALDKLQKFTTMLLLAGLATFILVGLSKADMSLVNPATNPDFLMKGTKGLFSAAFLMMYAVSQSGIMFFSRLAKNPKRDIPFAIIGTSIVLTVVYISMSIASSAVLPIEMTANQPLTYVAKEILPTPVFIFFMIAGPLMALATSLSASFMMYAEPIIVAVNDGWLPKKLGTMSKKGTPWVVMLLEYLVIMIPIALGWDLDMIANSVLLISAITGILQIVALSLVPRKYPEAWAKRKWGKKLPTWVFYVSIVIAICVQCALAYNSVSSVKPYIVITTVIVLIISVPYSIVMVNKGRIATRNIDIRDE